ncbi:MAG: TonB-dependent receptor [Vicinamibacteraceae bacterium]
MIVCRLPLIALLLAAAPAAAQDSDKAAPAQDPQTPRYQQTVEVVGVTPIHGIGLPKLKIPANVQVLTRGDTPGMPPELPALLGGRAMGMQISEVQGGTFQPDLLFRGFTGSPLLGAAQGLAVYQDGVRINEPFGDTVSWDTIPTAAIASVNVIPGSNPLFGLNTLGGALSIQTKDGFTHPGHSASLTMGSFGRKTLEVSSGGRRGSLAYFAASTLTDEDGWRDFSPSTVRRVYGDLAWRDGPHLVQVSVTAASNDVIGNGAVPAQLLAADRRAVFTHPDATGNRTLTATLRARRVHSARTRLDAVAYVRNGSVDTFNGDAADEEEEEGEGEPRDENSDVAFDGVNNMSDTRTNAGGLSAQLTHTAPLFGRENHFIVGGGLDAGVTRFGFASEWAHLTPDRGTIGVGLFDDEAAVGLRSRVLSAGIFATTTWSVTRALAVTASARANWSGLTLRDQIGTALDGDHRFTRVNPAAGMTYQLMPAVNLYGGYSESSRIPTAVELTCADPEDPCRLPNAFVSDPPLEQVVARTWEGGVRGAAGPLEWTLAAFATSSRDDIIFVSSGTLRGEGHFENVDRTSRRGVEAGIEAHGQVLHAFGSYSLQSVRFGTDLRIASHHHPEATAGEVEVAAGSRFPGVPLHTVKAGVEARVARLELGGVLLAQSSQFYRGDEANRLASLKGFGLLNASARYWITPRLAASVTVHNVFDAEYQTFGVLGDASLLGADFDDGRFVSPGAPRAAWLGVDVRF